MYVGVAIAASNPDLFEIPFFCFFMTGEARCSEMCPMERECAGIVLFDGVRGPGKSLCAVTRGTIRRNALFFKLLAMIIGMAIRATVMFHRIGKGSFMA